MTSLPWWKRSLMLCGVVAALAVPSAGRWSVRSAEPADGAVTPAFQYKGSGTCTGCHSVTKENPRNGFPNAVKFIKLNESEIWEKEDKHSIAYKQLDSERGRRMASLLQLDVTQRPAGCLGCHSASAEEVNNRQGDQYQPSEGVSCENCHGPSSAWFGPHFEMSFRTLPPEDWTKLRFTDLRTPAGQAEKCLSCHIGSVAEGKVVTHDMYAAGHPPLPSIEVSTFATSIPRHWWLIAERKDPKVKASLGYKDGQLEQTKLALVGSAVALKASLRLLADEAKSSAQPVAPGQAWPDYARFDCWSCHHDLKRDGWRQARGYPDGPPGRVPVAEWPLALVDLGIDHLARRDPAAEALRTELRGLEKALHDQANIRQFGKKAAIAKVADDFATWAEVLIKKLSSADFAQPDASSLLRKLVEKSLGDAEFSTPDYDSARHVAWTIGVLVKDLGDSLPNRPRIEGVLAKLDKGLKLTLPAGRNYDIEKQIGGALEVIGDYDPAAFKADVRELAELLPAR